VTRFPSGAAETGDYTGNGPSATRLTGAVLLTGIAAATVFVIRRRRNH